MMDDQLQKEKKKMLTLRVKNNIENGEWEKLTAAFPVAEEVGVSIFYWKFDRNNVRTLVVSGVRHLGLSERTNFFITPQFYK